MAELIPQARLRAFIHDPDGPVAEELRQLTARVERRAKRAAPVDTGRLRSSYTSQVRRGPRGLEGLVGTDVHYAIYQEYGTRHQPGQPHLRPALRAVVG